MRLCLPRALTLMYGSNPGDTGPEIYEADEPDRTFRYAFPRRSTYEIFASATTNKGCTNRVQELADVGVIPSPNFFWGR